MNERLKECESERVTFEHIDMKTKVVQHFESEKMRVLQVPSFCLTFRHFFNPPLGVGKKEIVYNG